MKNAQRFTEVYRRQDWLAGGVLSGDGSRIEHCGHLVEWLERQFDQGMKSVLDLGCGDLEWVGRCPSILKGRVSYYGVDVVPSLIAHHKRVFPWFRGEAACIEEEFLRVEADVVLVKDVLFHLCSGAAETVLGHVAYGRWQRLLVTSHRGANNLHRRGLRGGAMMPFNAEGLMMGDNTLMLPPPDERLPRHEDGEFLVFHRPPGLPMGRWLGGDVVVK